MNHFTRAKRKIHRQTSSLCVLLSCFWTKASRGRLEALTGFIVYNITTCVVLNEKHNTHIAIKQRVLEQAYFDTLKYREHRK
jgi:hypothetical protein